MYTNTILWFNSVLIVLGFKTYVNTKQYKFLLQFNLKVKYVKW